MSPPQCRHDVAGGPGVVVATLFEYRTTPASLGGVGTSFTRTPASAETTLEAVRSLARTARLLERAAGDLGMAQYRVLSAIAAGDERASRVAERFGLGRPTVSVAVDTLCRHGLVRRSESPGDLRATDLSITPKGRSLLGAVEAAMTAALTELCARSATGQEVTAALASLGPALDAVQAERIERARPARA